MDDTTLLQHNKATCNVVRGEQQPSIPNEPCEIWPNCPCTNSTFQSHPKNHTMRSIQKTTHGIGSGVTTLHVHIQRVFGSSVRRLSISPCTVAQKHCLVLCPRILRTIAKNEHVRPISHRVRLITQKSTKKNLHHAFDTEVCIRLVRSDQSLGGQRQQRRLRRQLRFASTHFFF